MGKVQILAETPKPSDLQLARDRVSRLEARFAEAQAAHDKEFAHRTFGEGVQESLQNLDRLREDLANARDRVAMVAETDRTKTKELRAAMLANPEASRVFEISTPDGRKIRQTAIDADTLQRSLNFGYIVTGQVFASGYVVPLQGASLFDGLIAAHGEQLVQYLSERGFVLKRDP